MTTRRALAILIKHATQNIQGAGCGLRVTPSQNDIEEVGGAVEKIWPKAYDFPLDDFQRLTLGIPVNKPRP